jgi:hypothetical protein
MKKFLKLRCPHCDNVTEHRTQCTICNHRLPRQPVGWGKFVILLFLAALLVFLTQFQGLDMASIRNFW